MSKKSQRCLHCYQVLSETDSVYHAVCRKKFFGTPAPVLLPYTREELGGLSKETFIQSNDLIKSQTRFSLDLEKKSAVQTNACLKIAGLEGRFILKPSLDDYPNLPELEDLSMHLASIAQIKTTAHSLIRLQSGELAFISQRIDRTKKGKLPMEDMCQLTETLTDDKYLGSMEKIGKVILACSSNPGFDVISFFELTLFCFLTGSADMHLKKFSLLSSKENDIGLAPAYDLVATRLIFPEGKDEMALPVNGKKKNLGRSDFDILAKKLKINAKTLDNTYKRFRKNLLQMLTFIDISFLDDEMKSKYKSYIKQRARDLFEFQDGEMTDEIAAMLSETPEVELIKESVKEILSQEEILIDKNTGEIFTKQNEDPLSRQLSLF